MKQQIYYEARLQSKWNKCTN